MIREIAKYFIENGIEESEAKAEAKLLVCGMSNLSIEDILSGKKIKDEDKIRAAAFERVKTHAPLQHILGYAYFMGDRFFVDKNVLIPRVETELLVNSAIACAKRHYEKSQSTVNVLDIGTGSGCVAIEVSKGLGEMPHEILGTDVSTAAIQIALKNMENLIDPRLVLFRKSDIFSSIYEDEKFDIIVSNPPYIPISEKDGLQDEVKNFDPPLALFTEDDEGVEFYERILSGAKKHLKAGGFVLFELGINQAPIVQKLGKKYGFHFEFIEKDLSSTDRVICFSR